MDNDTKLQTQWKFRDVQRLSKDIEEILRGILPKKRWRKYFKQLSVQLAVVAMELKRAFLWDIGPVQLLTDELLVKIVKEINARFLPTNYLCLVTMDDEKFIVNRKMLPLDVFEHVFIDVSKHFEYPKLDTRHHPDFVKHLNIYLGPIFNKFISGFANDHVSISNIRPECCVPGVFGILLGYPVVYFYNEQSKETNCLQGARVIVHQLKMFDVVVMSFSVPEAYKSYPTVKMFFEKWRAIGYSVPEVKYECFEKTLDVVVL